MFTFGRDHERNCAVANVGDPQQAHLISQVIDAVHDYLETNEGAAEVSRTIVQGFVEGGSGVWEQAGSWLRRLGNKSGEFESVWRDLSNHPSGKVRFRVACFLNDMPPTLAAEIGGKLQTDKHKQTREMAKARCDERGSSAD
jgi:hypothetical protein